MSSMFFFFDLIIFNCFWYSFCNSLLIKELYLLLLSLRHVKSRLKLEQNSINEARIVVSIIFNLANAVFDIRNNFYKKIVRSILNLNEKLLTEEVFLLFFNRNNAGFSKEFETQ